ncbi:MAG: hypothetical protein M3Q92_02010, partial [Actinomycetota bacterium]|nr:hypothetical protein [Actinomycetota bacterium]
MLDSSLHAFGERRSRQRADQALELRRLERLGERQSVLGPGDLSCDLRRGCLDRSGDVRGLGGDAGEVRDVRALRRRRGGPRERDSHFGG